MLSLFPPFLYETLILMDQNEMASQSLGQLSFPTFEAKALCCCLGYSWQEQAFLPALGSPFVLCLSSPSLIGQFPSIITPTIVRRHQLSRKLPRQHQVSMRSSEPHRLRHKSPWGLVFQMILELRETRTCLDFPQSPLSLFLYQVQA